MLMQSRLSQAEARLLDYESQGGFGRKIVFLPAAVWTLLVIWQERASQRWALAQQTPHRLLDMGITPEAAQKEASKPFWRA